VSGGGAAIAAYYAIDNISFLVALAPKSKRIAAFGISAGLAIGAWFIMAAMLYEPWPATAYAWIEQLFFIGTSAFALSQMIHGQAKLPNSQAEVVAVAVTTVEAAGLTVDGYDGK
jgi:hypothetical protein